MKRFGRTGLSCHHDGLVERAGRFAPQSIRHVRELKLPDCAKKQRPLKTWAIRLTIGMGERRQALAGHDGEDHSRIPGNPRAIPAGQAGALLERMLRDPRLSAPEREQLETLFEMIAERFHLEFREKLEHLKTVYEPFDPDGEIVPPATPADEPAQRAELARAFAELLLNANYVEMPREQIVACVEYQSQAGLVLTSSLSDYAELRVFYRGMRHEHRRFRPWLTPWRRQDERVHVFGRVAMMVRLAGPAPQRVYLKMFKNVVAEDLEMLLPYVRIRMRLVDHLKIGGSVAGGLATAGGKAFTAAIISPWLFLMILSGFVGAAVRAVFSFFSSKTRYMQALAASLYFQNLANNGTVLAHLVDTAEAEECKELLLAYYVLYADRDRDYTQEGLDRRVEQWLRAEFGLEVDFEVSAAVRKLLDKGLLARRPALAGMPLTGDVLKVHDLPSTLYRLDEAWDRRHGFGDHARAAAAGSRRR